MAELDPQQRSVFDRTIELVASTERSFQMTKQIMGDLGYLLRTNRDGLMGAIAKIEDEKLKSSIKLKLGLAESELHS